MKAMSTEQLRAASRRAREAGLTLALSPMSIARLDPDGVHVVDNHILVSGGAVRVALACMDLGGDPDTPKQRTAELLLEDFNALPEARDVLDALQAGGEEA